MAFNEALAIDVEKQWCALRGVTANSSGTCRGQPAGNGTTGSPCHLGADRLRYLPFSSAVALNSRRAPKSLHEATPTPSRPVPISQSSQ
jgi:hypothetical protein